MQYMLMYHEPVEEFAKRADPNSAQAYWGAWNAYIALGRRINWTARRLLRDCDDKPWSIRLARSKPGWAQPTS